MDQPNFKNNFYRVERDRLSKYNTFLNDNEAADNIYYDVIIDNNTQTVKLAEYSVTTNKVLIDNPSDYYLTISKFNLPIVDIPIFEFVTTEPPPGSNQIDRRLIITVSHGGNDVIYPIQYIPGTGVPSYDYRNPVYTYQEFIYMFNVSMREAIKELWNNFGPLPVPDPNNLANAVPELIFTNEDTPLDFRCPEEYDFKTYPTTVKIYFNYALFLMFENFLNTFFSYTAPKAYLISVFFTGNNYKDYANDSYSQYTGKYYSMTQDSATFYLWYDIKDVVITTSLPISPEIIGTIGSQGAYNTIPILTDVSTSFFGQSGQQKMSINYIPEPQYRLIDVNDHTQLSKIDFKFFYRTKHLELRNFYLAPLTTLTMKILFVKKSLFKN